MSADEQHGSGSMKDSQARSALSGRENIKPGISGTPNGIFEVIAAL
jgi:hypothetical protein